MKKEYLQKETLNYWVTNKNYNFYKTGNNKSLFLLKLFNKYIDKDSHITELGCNVGRNLKFLYEDGYKNLLGVEINKEAIQNRICPKEIPVVNSSIEEYIKDFKHKQFDVCFTMAVFEHIHSNSELMFKEIDNMFHTIIIIEDEKHKSFNHFPRNYKKVFYERTQIYKKNLWDVKGLGKNFNARVFI
jgi:SAM-dependent methyltransferase